jgi:hypothetical protein
MIMNVFTKGCEGIAGAFSPPYFWVVVQKPFFGVLLPLFRILRKDRVIFGANAPARLGF